MLRGSAEMIPIKKLFSDSLQTTEPGNTGVVKMAHDLFFLLYILNFTTVAFVDIKDWFVLFLTQLKETGIVEWFAVLFGIAEVLLAKRNNIWLYPTGIVSIMLSMYLFFHVHLYAEALLNLYYLLMSIYGWYLWVNKKSKPTVKISWTTEKELNIAIAISIIGFFFLYFILSRFTSSDVPVEDAIVASLAWAGMWLLAKRKIENWIFLNISNIIAIPLLIHKKLPLMALLTLFLFTVAVFGFFDWKKAYQKENKLQP